MQHSIGVVHEALAPQSWRPQGMASSHEDSLAMNDLCGKQGQL